MAWEEWDSKLIYTDFSERVVGRGHDLPLPFDLERNLPKLSARGLIMEQKKWTLQSPILPPLCPI